MSLSDASFSRVRTEAKQKSSVGTGEDEGDGAAAIKAYLPDVDVISLGQRRRPPPCFTVANAKPALSKRK